MSRPSSRMRIKNMADIWDGLATSLAAGAHQIKQALHLGVVGHDLLVIADIDKVVRMQAVLLIDIYAIVNVF